MLPKERPFFPKKKNSALQNALRYFPEEFHKILAKEFFEELELYGRIYMYRFMPNYKIYARPIHDYPGHSIQAKSIMHMIQNNLDMTLLNILKN